MAFISFIAATLGAFGAAGNQYQLLSPAFSFYLCLGAVAVIALNLPLNIARFIRRGRKHISLAGLAFGILCSALLGLMLKFTIENPITDVTNSTAQPPRFQRPAYDVRLSRGEKEFLDPSFQIPREYDPAFAEKQAKAYPNIYLLEVPMPPGQAMFIAGQIVAKHPEWKIVHTGVNDHSIEIEAEQPVFRSVDDFLIQAVPSEAGSQIRLRSRSRFGFTDFGLNAKRIRRFSEELVAAGAAMTPPMKVELRK